MNNNFKVTYLDKYNIKRKILDLIFFTALIFQDAGTFQKLPINLYQIIMLSLGVSVILFERKIFFSNKLFLICAYIFFVTFLINKFDADSLKTYIYFCMQLFIVFMYLRTFKNKKELLNVILSASLFLSIFIIVQEIAFKFNLPQIYDLSNYGFASNGQYVNFDGSLRAASFYAEPAHLSSILSFGFFLGILKLRDSQKLIDIFKLCLIIIGGLLTQSIIVYTGFMIFAIVYFVFLNNSILLNKIAFLTMVLSILLILMIVFDDKVSFLLNKLWTIFDVNSMNTDDLSSFAVISNLQIAIEKMKAGYFLGTGLDSNRLYYFKFLGMFYSNALMFLNYNDAASLFTRIFSEFGIVGILCTFYFTVRKFFYSIKTNDIILLSFTILFVVQGLRNGNYTYILATTSFVYLLEY